MCFTNDLIADAAAAAAAAATVFSLSFYSFTRLQ